MRRVQTIALLWCDAAGIYTAALFEARSPTKESDICACGWTREQAMDGLAARVSARLETGELDVDDLSPLAPDARARVLRVPVDIAHQVRGKKGAMVSGSSTRVEVICVHGRGRDGLIAACMPMLGAGCRVASDADVVAVVEQVARRALAGRSGEQLAGCIAPAEFTVLPLEVERERRGSMAADGTSVRESVSERIGERRRGRVRARERDAEVATLVELLTDQHTSVVVVGEPGSGRSTIILEAIARLGHAAARRTSAGRLIAGMQYLGEWQARLLAFVREMIWHGDLLVVEDLLDMIATGGSTPKESLASFLLPHLESGELQVVAECTPGELDVIRRLLPGLIDRLQPLVIEPLDQSRAQALIEHVMESEGRRQGVDIVSGSAARLVEESVRLMPSQVLPGRAPDLARELVAAAARRKSRRLDADLIEQRIVKVTGLRREIASETVPLAPGVLEAQLGRAVVGQQEACAAAARIVRSLKAGLRRPGRPLGVLLLSGPTGVGKTSLARALSALLFETDAEGRLSRVDMGELAAPGSSIRLLMSAGGQPSELIRSVRERPFQVVLLDEIEKAAGDVLDAILGLLDEGRLTDTYGRRTSFESCIIVLTSNLGATRRETTGFSASSGDLGAALESELRPELIARIDAVVELQPLAPATLRTIAAQQLAALSRREGLRDARIELEFASPVVDHVASAGADRRYGARPLERTIERLVVAPLARFLVEHPGLREARICVELTADSRVQLLVQDAD